MYLPRRSLVSIVHNVPLGDEYTYEIKRRMEWMFCVQVSILILKVLTLLYRDLTRVPGDLYHGNTYDPGHRTHWRIQCVETPVRTSRSSELPLGLFLLLTSLRKFVCSPLTPLLKRTLNINITHPFRILISLTLLEINHKGWIDP